MILYIPQIVLFASSGSSAPVSQMPTSWAPRMGEKMSCCAAKRECVPLAPAPQSSPGMDLILRWHKGNWLVLPCDTTWLKEELLCQRAQSWQLWKSSYTHKISPTASCPDLYWWRPKVKPLGELARMTKAWKLIMSWSRAHQNLPSEEQTFISHASIPYI